MNHACFKGNTGDQTITLMYLEPMIAVTLDTDGGSTVTAQAIEPDQSGASPDFPKLTMETL